MQLQTLHAETEGGFVSTKKNLAKLRLLSGFLYLRMIGD